MKTPWKAVAALLTALWAATLLIGTIAWAENASRVPNNWLHEWSKTDFSRHSVDLREIISGGVPRDGIPPIDSPRFVTVGQAARWVHPQEPVLVFEQGQDVRAYPLQVLTWHEIVNDVVGGRPVVVTFCPLCNSALVFDRKVNGRVLDFGTTGKLRNSDLVMWDRQTESWWQQLVGEAIVGSMTGSRLTFLPSPLVSFETFARIHPKGKVLSKDNGVFRPYGNNPYVGYDSMINPFLFQGRVDQRLPAMERVVVLELQGQPKAYPYGELAKVKVVNDRVGGRDVVVFFRKGTRSALDGASIARSRDVGAGVVFDRRVEGKTLTFKAQDELLVDEQTGSRWNMLGEAEAGPLKGRRLGGMVHGNHFAFAWLAFRPNSKIYKAP